MRHGVECLLKVQYEDVCLLALIDSCSPVMDDINELGFTAVIFPEGMLTFVQDAICLKVAHEVRTDDVFQ